MGIVRRVALYAHGFLKRYGPSNMKKIFWDREFASGHWNFIDNTEGDPVYIHLEKYVGHGSILDLGCGPGNTATELASPYSNYVGVDISEVALEKARKKTAETGRTARNRFACADFLSFDPGQKFEVILFRESMYHIPIGKVKTILDRYTQFLTEDGVFIVRIYLSGPRGEKRYRPAAVLRAIEADFDVIEKADYVIPREDHENRPTIMVFRPRLSATKAREQFATRDAASVR
jgi:SAM-dependent methyltransferase